MTATLCASACLGIVWFGAFCIRREGLGTFGAKRFGPHTFGKILSNTGAFVFYGLIF